MVTLQEGKDKEWGKALGVQFSKRNSLCTVCHEIVPGMESSVPGTYFKKESNYFSS